MSPAVVIAGAVMLAAAFVTPQASAAVVVHQQTLTQAQDGVTGISGISDVAVSPDGAHVYAASYLSGAVAVFARDRATGLLTYQSMVGGITSAFNVDVSPDGRNVYVASPGGSVFSYSRDHVSGALTQVGTTANAGGTSGFVSLSVSPDGRHVFAIGGSPSGLVVLSRDASTGALQVLQDLKDNVDGHALGQAFGPTTSPINNVAVSADGAFVYVTSTTDNAVSVFTRNTDTGLLSSLEVLVDGVGGVDGLNAASSLVLSPDGGFLHVSGQGEHSVATFSRNSSSGRLTYTGKVQDGQGGVDLLAGARSLALSPDGRYLYASSINDQAVTAFARDTSTGALAVASTVTSSGATGLSAPSGMVTDPLGQHMFVAGQSAHGLVVFRLPTPAVVLTTTAIATDTAAGAITLDAGLQVFDADDPVLASARVFIESGFVDGDVLSVRDSGPLVFNYEVVTGELTLTGSHSLAVYQAALRSVQFQPGHDPQLGAGESRLAKISFQVFDGANYSAQPGIEVTVSAASTHTLTYVAGPNGSLSGATSQVVAAGLGGSGVLAVPAEGYVFVDWSDGVTLNPRVDTDVVADIAVTARFARQAHTVTTVLGTRGGTFDRAGASVSHGDTAAFTLTLLPGYRLASVNGCAGSLAGSVFTTGAVTADCTVTARFAAEGRRNGGGGSFDLLGLGALLMLAFGRLRRAREAR